jgi:light-regulated signal transduction histidine kinase (bacteriophytochrome)
MEATGTTNLRAALNRVLQNVMPDTMAIQKYDVRRPDGVFEERYWSPINSPVLSADRHVEYIIHRVEDVTDFVKQKSADGGEKEKMEAEIFRSSQEVQQANHQLRAVNGELEAFSYSVSHDLRAPLRHIDGFADMLRNHSGEKLDAKGQRYLKTISDSAKRMGKLIDDLLVFSRMGRTEMRRTTVDLQAMTREVIKELADDAKGRRVVWKYQNLPTLQADPALLHQVMVNLLSNALKYSRSRDPAIIEISSSEAPAETVICVRDNGVGFDMSYVDKLFGVFQRLHREDEFEGTGIGLANVRRIINRHGGRVWAEGRLNESAAIYFSLPVGPMLAASTAPPADNFP